MYMHVRMYFYVCMYVCMYVCTNQQPCGHGWLGRLCPLLRPHGHGHCCVQALRRRHCYWPHRKHRQRWQEVQRRQLRKQAGQRIHAWQAAWHHQRHRNARRHLALVRCWEEAALVGLTMELQRTYVRTYARMYACVYACMYAWMQKGTLTGYNPQPLTESSKCLKLESPHNVLLVTWKAKVLRRTGHYTQSFQKADTVAILGIWAFPFPRRGSRGLIRIVGPEYWQFLGAPQHGGCMFSQYLPAPITWTPSTGLFLGILANF